MRLILLKLSVIACISLLSMNVPLAAQQAFFMGLGTLPTSTSGSMATDVSADGSVVVGMSRDSNASLDEGFIWRRDTGMQPLGFRSRRSSRQPRISSDGATVVGMIGDAGLPEVERIRPFRWTRESGIIELLAPTSKGGVGVYDVLDNGDAFGIHIYSVATPEWPHFEDLYDGLIWPAGNQQPQHLAALVGLDNFLPLSASSDGKVITGLEIVDSQYGRGFVWRQEGEQQGVTFLTNAGEVFPDLVSPDGNVFVGSDPNDAGEGALRWTNDGVTQLPPTASGAVPYRPEAVSGDGSVIVGSAAMSGIGLISFIWDEVHGTRDLGEVLRTEFGLGDVTAGWSTPMEARGISSDGRTIVGRGRNPAGILEAWIAFLGDHVVANSADFNGDDAVDGGDFLAWQRNVGLESGVTRVQATPTATAASMQTISPSGNLTSAPAPPRPSPLHPRQCRSRAEGR